MRSPDTAALVENPDAGGRLPPARSVLAVCAHPDDESFGMGAILDRMVAGGARASVLCFTRGEASTLGVPEGALADARRAELRAAAAELGVGRVELLSYADGGLSAEPVDRLAAHVSAMVEAVGADLVVTFDEGGITGHPDHCRATEAAVAGAPTLPVLAWAVSHPVADALNSEFSTGFVGRAEEEIDLVITVDRLRQQRAIACHATQSTDNAVLRRRLELLGGTESLRWLRRPTDVRSAS